MGKKHELQRDLGLVSVVAIAMGAMIGSGIFILPGLAMAEAGPAVILAFVLAAVLVIPAAVSIAELGTAMPEAGGDYVFIERGMGPGAGTIAGLGTWLMLMFKGALALVGGMFYLGVIFALPSVEGVAVAIGSVLIAVNIFGVKQTGGLQTIMVVVMVLILGVFVLVSLPQVEGGFYQPFFSGESGGLMTATAMVLVSYAGVTKVAAVAEEVKRPGRNLPLGLLLSLVLTTALYALIVFVLVGIVEAEELAGSNIPMVDAVEPFFGFAGAAFIVVAAMLALISTANAGILTASRYPFALSRDKLLPAFLGRVNDKLHTPVLAILITGGAMLAIIVFLPVEDIAKTAGSFQIIVYVLVNVALIAFRIKDPIWYQPEFWSPFYPWLQIFGIASGVGILTQMDLLPIIGGIGIIILGTVWYLIYGRQRVDREGIIGDAITDSMEVTMPIEDRYGVVVPIARREGMEQLLRLAAASASGHEKPQIILVNVVEVPDQTSLAQEVEAEDERMQEQEQLLEDAEAIVRDLGIPVSSHAIVGRSVSDAILRVIEQDDATEVILRWKGNRKGRDRILGSYIDPIVREATCEVTLVKLRHDTFGNIAVFVGQGPHSPIIIERATELVEYEEGATITMFNIQEPSDTISDDELKRRGRSLIEKKVEQARLKPKGYDVEVLISNDIEASILEAAAPYQTICIGTTTSRRVERALFGNIPERVGEKADGTVVIARGEKPSGRSLKKLLKGRIRRLFG